MSTTGLERLGSGTFARAAATGYRLLVLQVLFVITAGPGLAVVALLRPDVSNAPLAAAALLPVGPALSAVIFGWQHSRSELDDLRPGPTFWRGYRLNAVPVLRWWAPALAGFAVLAFNAGHLDLIATGWARVVLAAGTAVVALLLAIVVGVALVITTRFDLRTRDVVRLAITVLHRPGVLASVAATMITTVAAVALVSDWVIVFIAVPLALVLAHGCRLLLAEIEEQYTR